MARILVSEYTQEISSFNPVPGLYEDFTITLGEDILAYHRRVRTEVGGALSVFDARPDVEIVPGYSARGITSGGTVADGDFARMAGEFLMACGTRGRSMVFILLCTERVLPKASQM